MVTYILNGYIIDVNDVIHIKYISLLLISYYIGTRTLFLQIIQF